MNLQSSTLKDDESGEPLHVQQRKQIEAYREAWKEAGHQREPRVSVSRSIFALVDDRDRAYFGREGRGQDQIGYIDANTRAIFGRSYAAEPDALVRRARGATKRSRRPTRCSSRCPNQLGVDYNAHVIESILKVRRARARLALTALLLGHATDRYARAHSSVSSGAENRESLRQVRRTRVIHAISDM